jgi:hypothetical protein
MRRLVCTLAIAGALSASSGCAGILFDFAFNTVMEVAEEVYYRAAEPRPPEVKRVPEPEVVAP